jgi:pilus assembly protein Flp/PilA
MRKLVSRFVKNEEGAALVEYGLLVGLIAVVCIAAVTTLGGYINDVFTYINTQLVADLPAAVF